jgi:hypothetical protein
MKKTWQAPQLIILTRSKPEEAILSVCKTVAGASGSPAVTDWRCDLVTRCWYCDALASS